MQKDAARIGRVRLDFAKWQNPERKTNQVRPTFASDLAIDWKNRFFASYGNLIRGSLVRAMDAYGAIALSVCAGHGTRLAR